MERTNRLQEFLSPYEEENEFFKKLKLITNDSNASDTGINTFKENINRKIWELLLQAKYYIIEENYTETEWKDMIAEHYIHTKYDFKTSVCRVHLFSTDYGNLDDIYLGYFTLRKINSNDMVLSFIYPNWKTLNLEKTQFNNSFIMTAKKTVHIFSEEIEIQTTPFFVQDGNVTCCAHASILMLSHFLHLKFDYKKIRIPEIAKGYLRREKQYPTKGLIPEQIMEILTNNGIYIRPYNLKSDLKKNERLSEIKETVQAHVRSGLPVIMGIGKHAVLIIGYRKEENFDGFIFYDDSGVLIHDINKQKHKSGNSEYDNFIYCCDWNYILDYVEYNKNETVRFLVPFHEKVFAEFNDVKLRCSILEDNFNIKKIKYDEIDSLQDKRFFIADNATCKKFIRDNLVDLDYAKEDMLDFICNEQPHYLWCYQYKFDDEYYILFINSTYNINSDENNIYINKNLHAFKIKKSFCTITEINVTDKKVPYFNRINYNNGISNQADADKYNSKRPKCTNEQYLVETILQTELIKNESKEDNRTFNGEKEEEVNDST